ncbi:MAG TPA: hypothetical protein VF785_23285 [Gemmatimonadaceae bacterium]
MYKFIGVAVGLVGLAAAPASRPHASELTLRVESMSSRPVTFTVWMRTGARTGAGADSARTTDSLTKTTPASIPLDSATREIRVLTQANAAVRVRVLGDSRELQRPANAWGRDLRLTRVDDRYHVVFDVRLIQPR